MLFKDNRRSLRNFCLKYCFSSHYRNKYLQKNIKFVSRRNLILVDKMFSQQIKYFNYHNRHSVNIDKRGTNSNSWVLFCQYLPMNILKILQVQKQEFVAIKLI